MDLNENKKKYDQSNLEMVFAYASELRKTSQEDASFFENLVKHVDQEIKELEDVLEDKILKDRVKTLKEEFAMSTSEMEACGKILQAQATQKLLLEECIQKRVQLDAESNNLQQREEELMKREEKLEFRNTMNEWLTMCKELLNECSSSRKEEAENFKSNQALQGEIKDLGTARKVTEDGLESMQKLNELLQSELKEKEEELQDLKHLTKDITNNKQRVDTELQEAREVLIKVLNELGNNSSIGVKRMGELNCLQFLDAAQRQLLGAAKRKPREEVVAKKATELCTLWERHLNNPWWRPFLLDKRDTKRTINEEDERLTDLKREFGDELYNVVVTALKEKVEYNLFSCKKPKLELWNFQDDRKAAVNEAVSHVVEEWKKLRAGETQV